MLQVIGRVNSHWQAEHTPETRAFWDEAVYHTGNVEVYKLLASKSATWKEQANTFIAYTQQWARHNHYQGATETDSTRWKYKTYGEDMQHVLFADWQTCFQVYLDLQGIEQDLAVEERRRIYEQAQRDGLHVDLPPREPVDCTRRVFEVLDYMTRHTAHDYWWWADALYMAMPVMTKAYRMTSHTPYLEKMYENVLFTDSIMLDTETDLYFRDGKYIYPQHQTASGKKDFWARGNGWVLAALARALSDIPDGWEHRSFFEEKFQRLAHAVALCQQPDGSWTRSMLDPEQAPGPETSGTALFTYGLLWGINHHLLDSSEYTPVVERAWRYLTLTALQSDGTVGYVQPIGERAIPGQTIDQRSTSNFGIGAFLLAACEYARFVK